MAQGELTFSTRINVMLVCFWVFYVPLLGITGINLSLMSERHAFPQFLYPYQVIGGNQW
jgi:hypothetical protein